MLRVVLDLLTRRGKLFLLAPQAIRVAKREVGAQIITQPRAAARRHAGLRHRPEFNRIIRAA